VVILPSPVIFSSRPELRSDTTPAPDLRNAMPQGTSRSSATTPAAFGLGAPVPDGRGVGRGDEDALGLSGVPAVGAIDVGAPAGLSGAGGEQPASAPTAAPADPTSIVRREIIL
jgi:hypothetical protein